MEHRGTSSENNLIFDNKPSEKPVIYIKKKSGPKIAPLETAVLLFPQKDVWLLTQPFVSYYSKNQITHNNRYNTWLKFKT